MLTLKEERKLWKKGYKRVACLDESGRGSLAGPVTAAAVMIKIPKSQAPNSKQIPNSKIQNKKVFEFGKFKNWNLFENWKLKIENLKLRDSKKLSPKVREKIYKILTMHLGIEWGIGRVSEKVIDKINIKNAAELAMEKALTKLKVKSSKLKIDFLIIDGNHINNLNLKSYNYKLIPKADEKVFSCAAASIIAKVWRDRIMKRYHQKYPQYGFDKHKGYPTKYHLKMLKKFGPCKIHRRTFKPMKPE